MSRRASWVLGVSFVAWVSVACGDDPGPAEAPPEGEVPITLRALDLAPGCWVSRPASGADEDQLSVAARQSAEFQLSFDLQAIMLLTMPVVDDPTAPRWMLVRTGSGGTTRIEGVRVGSGIGWALLHMVAIWNTFDGLHSLVGDIDITPTRLVAQLGERRIAFYDDLIIDGDIARGCDAETGVSFEDIPRAFEGQKIVGPRCWTADGYYEDVGSTGTSSTSEGTLEPSLRPGCALIVYRARNRAR